MAELVRRAIDRSYGRLGRESFRLALAESFGTWKDRDFDGAEYVARMRKGMGARLGHGGGVGADSGTPALRRAGRPP